MLAYDDQRKFQRMDLECPVRFSVEGQPGLKEGTAKNLSATGLLLHLSEPVAAGSRLTVAVEPPSDITPPLHASVEVIRCEPSSGDAGGFEAACSIIEIVGN